MFIQRKIVEDIEKVKNRKEIIAIVGARQVGKTTIMNYFYKKLKTDKSNFISFDDLDILDLFDNNLELFIEKYVKDKDVLFIDEIQYSKKGGKSLKLIYDKYRVKIFISGSSKSELAIQSLKYLVGRVLIFEAFPLSLKDIIKYSKKENSFLFEKMRNQGDSILIKNEFLEYLNYGGYPEVFLEKSKEIKKELLKNIKNTYLLKEIKDILNYKDISEFGNILKILSIQDGNILNKSSIASDMGIHNNKIKEIIDTLEKTTILNIVRPFKRNKSKELIKSPKAYLFDLGFKNSIINNFNKIDIRQDKGQIYENFILNSLTKEGFSVGFWNYKNLYEMDFVIESAKGVFGFEIKSKLKGAKITESIRRFIEANKPKKIFVFCENIDAQEKYKNCKIIFTNYLNIFWIIKNEL